MQPHVSRVQCHAERALVRPALPIASLRLRRHPQVPFQKRTLCCLDNSNPRLGCLDACSLQAKQRTALPSRPAPLPLKPQSGRAPGIKTPICTWITTTNFCAAVVCGKPPKANGMRGKQGVAQRRRQHRVGGSRRLDMGGLRAKTSIGTGVPARAPWSLTIQRLRYEAYLECAGKIEHKGSRGSFICEKKRVSSGNCLLGVFRCFFGTAAMRMKRLGCLLLRGSDRRGSRLSAAGVDPPTPEQVFLLLQQTIIQ